MNNWPVDHKDRLAGAVWMCRLWFNGLPSFHQPLLILGVLYTTCPKSYALLTIMSISFQLSDIHQTLTAKVPRQQRHGSKDTFRMFPPQMFQSPDVMPHLCLFFWIANPLEILLYLIPASWSWVCHTAIDNQNPSPACGISTVTAPRFNRKSIEHFHS